MYNLKVKFISPGSFFSEETTKTLVQDFVPGTDDVNKPNPATIAKILAIADGISERHGATPYGFTVYVSQSVSSEDYKGNKHENHNKVEESVGTFFLGGTVYPREEVIARDHPDEAILRDNMRYNDITHVIVNENSYKTTQPFNPEKDTLLDYTPPHKKLEVTNDSYRM